MRDFVILPDVTCDLSDALRAEFNIGFLNGHLRFPDGHETPGFLDWGDMSSEEFYKQLKAHPNDFSTSPPNTDECCEIFKSYAEKGIDILTLTISSQLSGTYNFVKNACDATAEKYPDIRIRCIDSRRFSSGCGLMAIYASILRSEGKDVDEVADWLEQNKNRIHQAGWLDELSFVAKKGRISHAKALFGTLAGVKPIGEFDYNGLTTALAKAKGEKQGFKVLIEYIKRTIENPEDQIILIATSDRKKQAEIYRELIEKEIHPKKLYMNSVYPSCGINVGPGLMAAYYLGKPISVGLDEERKILTELLK